MEYNKDSKDKKQTDVFTDSNEINRLRYYCNIPAERVFHLYRFPTATAEDSFYENIVRFQNIPGTHYFFRLKRIDEGEIALSRDDNWNRIARFYTSPRKNKEMVLYRYAPMCKNIMECSDQHIEPVKENAYRFEDFEEIGRTLEIDPLKHSTGHDTAEKRTVFLPKGWGLDYDLKSPYPLPFVTLFDDSPLVGKRSLLLDASKTAQMAGVYSSPYPITPYRFSCYVKGLQSDKTKLQIQVRCHNNGSSTTIKRLFFDILQEKTYHISWEITDYPADSANITIHFFVSNGSILIDQFEIETITQDTI